MVMQIRRTATADNPPSGLAQGQLAVEMGSDPPKLWCGVPTSIDVSGRILIAPSPGGAAYGATPPASPSPGDLWFDPVEGQLYIWFDDGTSSQWVVTINQGGGGGGAPTDVTGTGTTFVLQDQPTINQPAIRGIINASNPPAGQVGEVLTASGSGPTPPSYSTNLFQVPAQNDVATLNLTPGNWLLTASCQLVLRYDSGQPAFDFTHAVWFSLQTGSGIGLMAQMLPFANLPAGGVFYPQARCLLSGRPLMIATGAPVILRAAMAVPGTPSVVSDFSGIIYAMRYC